MPSSPAEPVWPRCSFDTEEEAAMAYDVVALKRGGQQAELNLPLSMCA